eukprot:2667395-Amphidinium_carterae.1
MNYTPKALSSTKHLVGVCCYQAVTGCVTPGQCKRTPAKHQYKHYRRIGTHPVTKCDDGDAKLNDEALIRLPHWSRSAHKCKPNKNLTKPNATTTSDKQHELFWTDSKQYEQKTYRYQANAKARKFTKFSNSFGDLWGASNLVAMTGKIEYKEVIGLHSRSNGPNGVPGGIQ